MNPVRAVIADELGPPENYEIRATDPGTPGAGEVRVSVMAAAVSFVDVLLAGGGYQVKPPVPYIPGTECAGVIEQCGPGVDHWREGDRVTVNGIGGAFCEARIATTAELNPVPDALDFAEAAAFPTNYGTAWLALAHRARLEAGETVLVLGAAGGVGVAAIQAARALGARVIASASDADKRAVALRAGAHEAVDARADDWRAQIKALTDGKGVDVVVDPVGGDVTETAFRTLGWNGRHLVIGFVAGIPRLPTNLALLKGASLMGVDFRQFPLHEPERSREHRARILELAADRILCPIIGARYGLESFQAAMEAGASGRVAGRVVIEMAR